LIFVDLVTYTTGFKGLRRLLRSSRVAKQEGSAPADISTTIAALNIAARYYPKHVRCLQHSAVATWLIRRKGVAASFVIGCRKIPFYAHAWVEVAGAVVNDKAAVRDLYPELERL
jgi:hypothetical protein